MVVIILMSQVTSIGQKREYGYGHNQTQEATVLLNKMFLKLADMQL